MKYKSRESNISITRTNCIYVTVLRMYITSGYTSWYVRNEDKQFHKSQRVEMNFTPKMHRTK